MVGTESLFMPGRALLRRASRSLELFENEDDLALVDSYSYEPTKARARLSARDAELDDVDVVEISAMSVKVCAMRAQLVLAIKGHCAAQGAAPSP